MAVYNMVNQLIGKSLVGAIALTTTLGICTIAQAESKIPESSIPIDSNQIVTIVPSLLDSEQRWFNWDNWLCPAVVGAKCRPWVPPTPGSSQINPIMPVVSELNRFIFRNVPSGRWYDPPTTYGFHFLMNSDSLFTKILDFPTGIDNDNLFTVSVGNKILGEFGPSQSVDFVALLGQGVSEFTITGIDPFVDATNSTAFPIKLEFNTDTGDFEMQALEHPQNTSVPEPGSVFGILTFGTFGVGVLLKRQRQQAK